MCKKALRVFGVIGAVVLCVAMVPAASAGVVIHGFEFVTVGNPGNGGQPGTGTTSGYGEVPYEYLIGKHPVTAGQYADFLDAVAKTDTYGLWNSNFLGAYGAKIQRSGSAGNYSYNVASDWADRPVNFVNWGDAARFANWLHNDRPTTGVQDLTTTEDGAYFLNGAVTNAALMAVTRNPDAVFFIPTHHEWYKAAFHKNDGVTANYWYYPTRSDDAPSKDLSDPDRENIANFGYGLGGPYWRNEVGAFTNSAGPYGTFDQGGNVYEWADVVYSGGLQRGTFGGNWEWGVARLQATQINPHDPTYENEGYGFRIAGSILSVTPELTTDPADGGTLDFGIARVGTTSDPLGITATNTGGGASTLSGEFPAAGGAFAPTDTLAFGPLAYSASASRNYTFTPAARGAASLPVIVTSDGGDSTITLAGTGVGPVYQSDPVPGSTIDFGEVMIDSFFDVFLKIENVTPDGDLGALTDLTILFAEITGDDADLFSLIAFAPFELSYLETDDLQIRFDATGADVGPKEALLRVFTDENAPFGASGSYFDYHLVGTVAIPEPSSLLLLLTAVFALACGRRRRR